MVNIVMLIVYLAIELDFGLSANVLRHLELQGEKAIHQAEVTRLEKEMKRLQGQIVAAMGRSCSVCAGRRMAFPMWSIIAQSKNQA